MIEAVIAVRLNLAGLALLVLPGIGLLISFAVLLSYPKADLISHMLFS